MKKIFLIVFVLMLALLSILPINISTSSVTYEEETTVSTSKPKITETETKSPTTQATIKTPPIKETEVVETKTVTPIIEQEEYADNWFDNPPIPEFVSLEMIEVYKKGQELGRNPEAFSKIGDCQNISPYFLNINSNTNLFLGEYTYLGETIDTFSSSLARASVATKGGMNAASALNIYWSNSDKCSPGESPVDCEIRLNNPAFVIIGFEEAWDGDVGKYTTYLERLVEHLLEQGIVPIVGTKADNLEGGNKVNQGIVAVAEKYRIPLWNFWAAAQELPNGGLSSDGFHLTNSYYYRFDNSSLKTGATVRNLTALQTLHFVHLELQKVQ